MNWRAPRTGAAIADRLERGRAASGVAWGWWSSPSERAQDRLRACRRGTAAGVRPWSRQRRAYVAAAARWAFRRVHSRRLGRARSRPLLRSAGGFRPGRLRGLPRDADRGARARPSARRRPLLGWHRSVGALRPPARPRRQPHPCRYVRRLEGLVARDRGPRSDGARAEDALSAARRVRPDAARAVRRRPAGRVRRPPCGDRRRYPSGDLEDAADADGRDRSA